MFVDVSLRGSSHVAQYLFYGRYVMKRSLEKYAFWLKVKEEQGDDLSMQQSKAVADYKTNDYIECRDCDEEGEE